MFTQIPWEFIYAFMSAVGVNLLVLCLCKFGRNSGWTPAYEDLNSGEEIMRWFLDKWNHFNHLGIQLW